jgi:hypothetical protein
MEALVFWRYDAKYKEVRINIDNNDKNTGQRKKEPKDKKRIMITIKEAVTKSELTDYIKFPFTLYKNNKYWVPPLLQMSWKPLIKPKSGFENAEAYFYRHTKTMKLLVGCSDY